MKHNPGPWHFHQATATDGAWIIKRADNGYIASSMSEEDACLIAAAPELLAMLQALVETGELRQLGVEDFSQIETLIAKATGGAK